MVHSKTLRALEDKPIAFEDIPIQTEINTPRLNMSFLKALNHRHFAMLLIVILLHLTTRIADEKDLFHSDQKYSKGCNSVTALRGCLVFYCRK